MDLENEMFNSSPNKLLISHLFQARPEAAAGAVGEARRAEAAAAAVASC